MTSSLLLPMPFAVGPSGGDSDEGLQLLSDSAQVPFGFSAPPAWTVLDQPQPARSSSGDGSVADSSSSSSDFGGLLLPEVVSDGFLSGAAGAEVPAAPNNEMPLDAFPLDDFMSQLSSSGSSDPDEADDWSAVLGVEWGSAGDSPSPDSPLLSDDSSALSGSLTSSPLVAFPADSPLQLSDSSPQQPAAQQHRVPLPVAVDAVDASVSSVDAELPAAPTRRSTRRAAATSTDKPASGSGIAYDQIHQLPKYKRKAKRLTKNTPPAPAAVGAAARAQHKAAFRELSEDELLRLSGVQIDEYVADLRMHKTVSADDDRSIKRVRRLVKNREYAQQSRDKKRQAQVAAQREAQRIEREAAEVADENARLADENQKLRDHLLRVGRALQAVPEALSLLAGGAADEADQEAVQRTVSAAASNAVKGTAFALFVVLFSFAVFLPAMVPSTVADPSDVGARPHTGRVLLNDDSASGLELTFWEAYAPMFMQQVLEVVKHHLLSTWHGADVVETC